MRRQFKKQKKELLSAKKKFKRILNQKKILLI